MNLRVLVAVEDGVGVALELHARTKLNRLCGVRARPPAPSRISGTYPGIVRLNRKKWFQFKI